MNPRGFTSKLLIGFVKGACMGAGVALAFWLLR
jgi:hypothetical protein